VIRRHFLICVVLPAAVPLGVHAQAQSSADAADGAQTVKESLRENTPADPVITMRAVKVTADTESAVGPVDGYAAARSATATRTDTALRDIPQSNIPNDRFLGEPGDVLFNEQSGVSMELAHRFNDHWSLRQGIRGSGIGSILARR
jgi:outer membrane receptor protein involved in Fe transport